MAKLIWGQSFSLLCVLAVVFAIFSIGYIIAFYERQRVLLRTRKILNQLQQTLPASSIKSANDSIEGLVDEVLKRTNQQQHAIELLNIQDRLTGLFNREQFYRDLIQIVQQQPQPTISLLNIDIDDFKEISSSYSSEQSDLLIKRVSERVLNTLSTIMPCKNPTIAASKQPASSELLGSVYRLVGDEFAIIIEHTDQDAQIKHHNDIHSQRLTELILSSISEPINLKGCLVQVSATVGIAKLDNMNHSDELIKAAKIAMRHSKARDKGGYAYYDEHMAASNSNVSEITSAELKAAMQNPGELELLLHPIFDSHSHQIVGAKTELIWHNMRLGDTKKSQFQWLLDRSDIAVDLDIWSLEQTQILAENIGAEYHDFNILKPVETRSLCRPQFIRIAKELSLRNQSASANIVFVTSSLCQIDYSDLYDQLIELQQAGYKIGIIDLQKDLQAISCFEEIDFSCANIPIHLSQSSIENRNSQLGKHLVNLCSDLGINAVASFHSNSLDNMGLDNMHSDGEVSIVQSLGIQCYESQQLMDETELLNALAKQSN